MTKKDYEKAARIAQIVHEEAAESHIDVTEAFVELFCNDNPAFDEARFRRACVPGAKVRARRAS